MYTTNTIKECLAAFSVVLILVAVPFLVGWYGRWDRSHEYSDNLRIFDLTGVAKDGVWTTEKVAGYNYWRRRFPPAKIQVRSGDEVLLRLKSADVTHYFYCPKLGIDKVKVTTGHVENVRFTAGPPGIYVYSCEAICGDCHYYMRGVIEVLAQAGKESTEADKVAHVPACPHDPAPSLGGDFVTRGHFLYRKLGCMACHEGPGVGMGINVPADLRYEGSKVKPEWLASFLLEPHPMRWRNEGKRPFIQMPNLYLSEEQGRDLAAYLLQNTDETLIPSAGIDWEAPATPEEIDEGRELYKQYQCQGCHQLGGVGRQIGPSHDGVGSRLRPDYMYRWISDPGKIVPGTPMPDKGLWEEEVRALVRYLQTLKNEAE